MSTNYHHDQIDKLEDFRNLNFIINTKHNVRKHIQGTVNNFLIIPEQRRLEIRTPLQ